MKRKNNSVRRSICSRATRTDELLCMLIILKQTNEEVARTLGISRASVLQNRYRLRNKLNLPEGSDLDTEIRRLLTDINQAKTYYNYKTFSSPMQ